MAVDLSVYQNQHTLGDYMQRNQAFNMEQQAAGIDAQMKKNIYATQVLSAAAATGSQDAWNQGLSYLHQNGIDVSNWSPNVQIGQQQAQAARLAQSPLGALLNAGSKMDANSDQVAIAGGVMPQGGGNAIVNSLLKSGSLTGGVPVQLPQSSPQPSQQNVSPPPLYSTPQSLTLEEQGAIPQGAAVGGAPLSATMNNKIASSLTEDQLPPVMQQAISAQKQTSFTPPPKDPTETQAAYQARVQNAFQAWKESPDTIQAQEAAKGIGTETAKQTGAAAQSEQMKQKLIQNIDGLLAINDKVPDSTGASPELKVGIEKRFGRGADDAMALSQWDQLNHAQILNGLAQLVAQSAAGSSIRSNKTIVQLLSTGQGVPSDLPASARKALLLNLKAELENSSVGSENVKNALTGAPQQPMNAIPVTVPNGGDDPVTAELKRRGVLK